ncbi:hypothetical protein ACEWFW_08140 [Bifidobacterium catenulatum subsp. kashiwanohense]|uniref:hypothetical protein n=1 Tax=Bifidobacterium catenulatum TaxID=1686 RepID=UPI003D014CCA
MELSSFRSTVEVGDFPVWLFKAGVKPSETVGLGCVANVAGTTYGKQARWNTDGSVTLIGGLGSSDIVQCFPKIIPVPDGVEFRTHRRLSPRGGSQNIDGFTTSASYITA